MVEVINSFWGMVFFCRSERHVSGGDVTNVAGGIIRDDKIESDRVLDDGDVKEGSVKMNGVFDENETCNGILTAQSQTPNSTGSFC
jgi:hypothetical protein